MSCDNPSILEIHISMQIVWLSLLSIGTNVLALALPLALLQVYDRILPNQSEGSAIVIFGGVFVALVLAGVFRFVRATIFARLSAEQDFHNSMALAETILGSDASEENGRVALSSSTRARDLHVGQSLISLYDAPFAFIFLALVWFLGGAVVLAPVVIVVLASAALFTGIGTYREVLQKSVDAEAKLAVQASNLLQGPENANFLAQSAERLSAFAALRRAQASVALKLDRFAVLQTDVMQSAGLAATVAIVGVGAASVLAGDMTTGGLAACTLLGSRGCGQLIGVVAALVRYQSTLVASKGLANLEVSHPKTPSDQTVPAMIKICGKELDISDLGITLVHVNNSDTRTQVNDELRGSLWASTGTDDVVFVDRHPKFLSGSLLENLSRFSKSNEVDALSLSKELGLDALVGRLSKGYFTQMVASDDGPLSKGGLKRAAIIAAVVGDPKLVIIDGPEAGLDATGQEKLLTCLNRISKNITVILITGSTEYREAAGQILALDPMDAGSKEVRT